MAKRIVHYKLMVCTRCGEECQRTNGSQKYCLSCGDIIRAEQHKQRNIKYRLRKPRGPRNSPIDRDRAKRWIDNNKEKRASSIRAYNDRNRKWINDKSKERIKKPEVKAKRRVIAKKYDAKPHRRLDQRMSSAIRLSLREAKAGRSWETLVGYSLEELRVHIERQFNKGMSWENMSEWHLDHIVAKIHFNYVSPDQDEFKACWSLANLRPLWADENLSKHARRTHLI